jgi:hypothetical protein
MNSLVTLRGLRARVKSKPLPATGGEGEGATAADARCYSAAISPEPPNSLGKSLNLGRPSRIGSTVSA